MLSEEEIKAIENLEELSHYCSLRAIDIEEENSNLWANFCVSIQKVENLIETQQAEIKQLQEDMSNMYDEKVVRNILEDECGLSKYEIDEILN